MTSVIDEFKTMLALAGNKRLPQYETEIFADKDLTKLYLHNLCKVCEWYCDRNSNVSLAYHYAWYIINGRWPEAEAIIANDPTYAFGYACYIIKDRWPEAEAAIRLDIDDWYEYKFRFNLK